MPTASLTTRLLATVLFATVPSGCGDDAPATPAGRAEPAGPSALEPAHAPRRADVPLEAAPRGIAVGQWVRYRVSWREGGFSEMTYRIVGEQDGAHWLEIDDRRRGGHNVTRLLVDFRDRTSVDSMAVRHMIQKSTEDEIPVPFPSRALSQARPLFEPFLKLLVADWATGSQEDISATAGHFPSAFRTEGDLAFAGQELLVTSWHHPAVPITALVKMEGREGNRHTVEIAAYGDQGAIPAWQ